MNKPTKTEWRNRIIGTGMEDAEQLLANPKNWRVHPKAQQTALEGALNEIGWVQNVIVNQRTGFVVDGHARIALAISKGRRFRLFMWIWTKQRKPQQLVTAGGTQRSTKWRPPAA